MHKKVNGFEVELTAEEVSIIEAGWAANAAEQLANQYIVDRIADYPTIGDQLDALWKGGQAQADMNARIDGVKVKHPKGKA